LKGKIFGEMVDLHEIGCSIDTLEFNDSYIQLDIGQRVKQFINLSISYILTIPKLFFTDQQLQNHPLIVFKFGINEVGKSYERKVYSLTDMLGNVGGISGILNSLASVMVYVLCKPSIDT